MGGSEPHPLYISLSGCGLGLTRTPMLAAAAGQQYTARAAPLAGGSRRQRPIPFHTGGAAPPAVLGTGCGAPAQLAPHALLPEQP